MKVLYIEPIVGISGDMLLSGFLSLGMDRDYLHRELRKISPIDFKIKVEDVITNGVKTKRTKFKFKKEDIVRGLKDIKKLVLESKLDDLVKKNTIMVFEKLAEVESRIHGVSLEDIHFHELGAIDTLLDIAGFFISLKYFQIDKVYYSKIPIGKGFINSAHGKMPVPAYATLELLKGNKVFGIPVEKENITPTAISLITTVGTQSDFPDMEIENVGYSSGHFIFKEFANMLRMTIGRIDNDLNDLMNDEVYVCEFQIDDMNPEVIGYFYERAFDIGAIDVYMTPIYMKKNRPGVLITVLFREGEFKKIVDLIFSETSTIGFRIRKEKRVVIFREVKLIDTKYGKIKVKESFYNGKKHIKPEFESLKNIAKKRKIPLREIYELVIKEIDK
ncbi:MAG: nickel pincer cofactor biosynthesis protein LarC [Proteobacteria bacterium]|nr:nickel pincer cofactor biosynthesis protein LarC [Pseudomonadota bacterium]